MSDLIFLKKSPHAGELFYCEYKVRFSRELDVPGMFFLTCGALYVNEVSFINDNDFGEKSENLAHLEEFLSQMIPKKNPVEHGLELASLLLRVEEIIHNFPSYSIGSDVSMGVSSNEPLLSLAAS